MANTKLTIWTEPMDALLAKLWNTPPSDADYLPTAYIGGAIRKEFPNFKGALTRNACIGRAGRINLPPRLRAKPVSSRKKKKAGKTVAFNSVNTQRKLDRSISASKGPTNAWVGHNIANKAKEAAAAPPEPEYKPDANNVPYLEAGDGQCMWPVGFSNGATIVCGCKRWDNGSRVRPSMYCAHHSRQGSGGPQRYTPKNKDRRGRPAPRFS